MKDERVALFSDLVGTELDESSLPGGAIFGIRPLAEVVGGEFWNVGVGGHNDEMAGAVEDRVPLRVRTLGMHERQKDEMPA
jgi:hypothetical protein